MLKLPPPIWALLYVLIAAAISWSLGWPKLPGLPLAPLGIALVALALILPVWAIVLFRREAPKSAQPHLSIASWSQAVPTGLPATPCIWASLSSP